MAGLITTKDKIGVVTSNRMDKTIVVAIDRQVQHPRYKRYIRRTKKYKVHDEKNECSIGDTVRIRETRPLSKDKYFKLVEIVGRAKVQTGS
ncbi:30S ribosomal protein S17 [bacterium]|nr:30S ribosomal protein S17 [bacterium]